MGSYTNLALDSLFTFGKHIGEQVEDVIHDDPDYIEWLIDNEVVDFDEEAMEKITKAGIA